MHRRISHKLLLFILVAFILNHMSYVLISTSRSSAHNGVHLISVKLCQLLFKLCLQSDCNLHTVNQLCMLHIPDKTQYVWDTTYLWTPSYAHKKCIVMCLCIRSKSIEHNLWSVL